MEASPHPERQEKAHGKQDRRGNLPNRVSIDERLMEVEEKERIDGKTIRRYDLAKTPYRRVLNLEDLPLDIKARLTAYYVKLNPVALRTSIDAKVALLWKIVR